jgi:hypothetical protein
MTLREKIIQALEKPNASDAQGFSMDEFDPWGDIVKGIHGSYNSACDELMLDALKAVCDKTTYAFIDDYGLAGEMALYILSGHGLTDYGTSPRGTWPDHSIADLWPAIIDKWEKAAEIRWGAGWNGKGPPTPASGGPKSEE